NWKTSVALLSGVAAKEIVVSTIGVLYSEGESADEEETSALSGRLVASGDFNQASAFALLIFILIYFPCIATVSAIAAEAGWKWALASIVYSTSVAWVLAYAVYHLMSWLL
ncbi:MAG TPA: ferrous iron transport protein B, partial [Candidatus Alistipes excrementipullorum]|nr:ferrous iron transport protein B [Candidatus Alistipes excrementipullorum]